MRGRGGWFGWGPGMGMGRGGWFGWGPGMGMGRGGGFGWGRGFGMGWGRGNPYPFCRTFPWMPRGWWAWGASPYGSSYGGTPTTYAPYSPYTAYPGYPAY
jgi:hypothetical protein